jgi:hypothetical protein
LPYLWKHSVFSVNCGLTQYNAVLFYARLHSWRPRLTQNKFCNYRRRFLFGVRIISNFARSTRICYPTISNLHKIRQNCIAHSQILSSIHNRSHFAMFQLLHFPTLYPISNLPLGGRGFLCKILSRIWGCDYRRGMVWVICFIDHLYSPLLTTSNHSGIANPHIL